jgi:hypothetical protein
MWRQALKDSVVILSRYGFQNWLKLRRDRSQGASFF